ncbi:hypothetical protein AgCh_025210 [Apium graveolens]
MLLESNGNRESSGSKDGVIASRKNINLSEFKSELDPVIAGVWLKEMEEVFNLVQVSGERSVSEFEAKFTELARLVPEYVSVEIQKVRRFQHWLKPEIRRGVVALQPKIYSSMVQATLVMESEQKLTVRDESDRKRKSEDVKDKANQGESIQGFENWFGRSKSKRFRR